MLATTVFLGVLLTSTSVYGLTCPSLTSSWGNTRMEVVNPGAPDLECEREFCFDSGAAQTFPFSDPHSSALVSQNCQVNKHQLTNAACQSTTNVVGYDCKMCQCSYANPNRTWQEYNTDGRTCKAYLCQDLRSPDQSSELNCSSTELLAFLPKSAIGKSLGMYMKSGTLAPASLGSSFSEYDPKWMNYSCPPATDQYCVNNPDRSAVGAVNYQAGSFYYSRSNSTNGCIVDKCLPGASSTTAGSWGGVTFTPDVEVSANPALLGFVQTWCPLSSNRRLSRCYYSSSPGKMYFAYSSTGCTSSQTTSFCSQFYCDCPSTFPDGGMTWYAADNKTTNTRPPGVTGMDTPVPNWSTDVWTCRQYFCSSGSPRNVTTSGGSVATSTFGAINPCDQMTGTSSIGEYWSGTSFVNFPQNQRSAAIYELKGANNPLGTSASPTFGKIQNATCAALGSGTCWEVKPYTIKTYSSSGFCPDAGVADPAAGPSCSSPSTSYCHSTTMPRDPVVPNGNYIGTKIQCFAPRENFVMQPYCMRNTKLQSAYEGFDTCLNNANYVFNIASKAESGGRCSSRFRDRLLAAGKCDDPIFQSYIRYRATCYCDFLTKLNAGGTSGANSQSAQAQWETVISGDTSLNGTTGILSTLASYGCNYVPIKCNGGSVSFSVTKKKIMATMKVGLPCKEINPFELQRRLQIYWTNAEVVTIGANRNLRILSKTDIGTGATAACSVAYSAFVKNSVYAGYISGNLTAGASGNAGAIYESTSGNSVGETVQVSSANSLAVGALGFFVSVICLFA